MVWYVVLHVRMFSNSNKYFSRYRYYGLVLLLLLAVIRALLVLKTEKNIKIKILKKSKCIQICLTNLCFALRVRKVNLRISKYKA